MLNLTHDELINLRIFLENASLPCRMELDPNATVKCDTAHIKSVQTKVCELLHPFRTELEVIKKLLQDTYLLVCLDDSQEYRVISYNSDTGEIFVQFDEFNEMTMLDSELKISDWIFYKLVQQEQEQCDTKLLESIDLTGPATHSTTNCIRKITMKKIDITKEVFKQLLNLLSSKPEVAFPYPDDALKYKSELFDACKEIIAEVEKDSDLTCYSVQTEEDTKAFDIKWGFMEVNASLPPERKAVMPYTLEKILEKLTMDQAFMICRYLDENPHAATDMIGTIVVSHPDLQL